MNSTAEGGEPMTPGQVKFESITAMYVKAHKHHKPMLTQFSQGCRLPQRPRSTLPSRPRDPQEPQLLRTALPRTRRCGGIRSSWWRSRHSILRNSHRKAPLLQSLSPRRAASLSRSIPNAARQPSGRPPARIRQ